jgi:hypothetical protein
MISEILVFTGHIVNNKVDEAVYKITKNPSAGDWE